MGLIPESDLVQRGRVKFMGYFDRPVALASGVAVLAILVKRVCNRMARLLTGVLSGAGADPCTGTIRWEYISRSAVQGADFQRPAQLFMSGHNTMCALTYPIECIRTTTPLIQVLVLMCRQSSHSVNVATVRCPRVDAAATPVKHIRGLRVKTRR